MSKKSPFNPVASYEELQKLPKEKAVRSIVDSSIIEGKQCLSKQTDLEIIEEALRRERGLKEEPRRGIITPLRAKIKKLKKQTTLDIKVDEVTTPDLWQPARDYYSAAQRFLKASVACQVMLGFELVNLKKNLGYIQGGKRKKQKAHDALFASFEEHVKAEIGISKDTARRFINMSEAVKRRLKSCYKNLPLLEKPITEYTDDELKILDKAVELATDGETQKSLLIEWKIAKKPQGSACEGGDTTSDDDDEEDEEPTMQQLAFALFASPLQDLCNLRTHGDYEKALSALPLNSDDPDEPSLIAMKQNTEGLLNDINQALEKLQKENAPKKPATKKLATS